MKNPLTSLATQFTDDLKSFRMLEFILAITCVTIPIWLRLADDNHPFRFSISDYVHMPRNYIFGMMLCMPAMLFIFNGAVYFHNENEVNGLKRSGKWYNIILGLALLGVILFPSAPGFLYYLHIGFAVIFFVGNAVVALVVHDEENHKSGILLAILTVISFAVMLIFKNSISMLCAEWVSLAVIGIHTGVAALGVISREISNREDAAQS